MDCRHGTQLLANMGRSQDSSVKITNWVEYGLNPTRFSNGEEKRSEYLLWPPKVYAGIHGTCMSKTHVEVEAVVTREIIWHWMKKLARSKPIFAIPWMGSADSRQGFNLICASLARIVTVDAFVKFHNFRLIQPIEYWKGWHSIEKRLEGFVSGRFLVRAFDARLCPFGFW